MTETHEQTTHTPDEASPLLSNVNEPEQPPAGEHVSQPHGDSLWREFTLLCRYSIPSIATYLVQYSFTVITTAVAGHLGAHDLAAASIGLTTMTIVGFALFEGMATALDTLCAQAYGSGHLASVGLHVQRMILFMSTAFVPVGAIWLCSPSILPLFLRDPDLGVRAGQFLRVSLIGLPGYAYFEAGKRFLQAQGDFRSAMGVLLICTPVNAFLSWFFAFRLDMGLEGAALGQALTNNLRPVLLLLHIVISSKWSHKCWVAWSSRSFSGWGPMIRLSLAGSAVNLAEWFAFEILGITTSYIDANHLAAQTILNTVSIIMWHIPLSIGVAVSTRVGHLIGGGLLKTARRASILYALIFASAGIFNALILFLTRNTLSSMFSEDAVVRSIATKSMPVVAVFQIIDAIMCGCNSMMRGLGLQTIAVWVVLVVNYTGAVPLAIWLELGYPDLKLDGLWIGIGIGMVLITTIECEYMRRIRWQDCFDGVKKREQETGQAQ